MAARMARVALVLGTVFAAAVLMATRPVGGQAPSGGASPQAATVVRIAAGPSWQDRVEELWRRLDRQEQALGQLAERAGAMEQALGRLAAAIGDLDAAARRLADAVGRLEARLAERAAAPADPAAERARQAQIEPAQSGPAPAARRTYVVKPGDTLGRIARQLGLDLRALIALNPRPSIDHVEPGEVLRLP